MWVDKVRVGDKVRILFQKKEFKPIEGKIIAFYWKEIHLDLGNGRTMALSIGDPLVKGVKKVGGERRGKS